MVEKLPLMAQIDSIYYGSPVTSVQLFCKRVCCFYTSDSNCCMFALISHAQGLAALQAYCHWMAQYYLETHRQQQHQEKFVALVSKAVDALVPLLNKDVSWLLIDLGLFLGKSYSKEKECQPYCKLSTYSTT